MTHADAFLQAILNDPDDDAPRLLFADWLEEYGDPDRAEFIRVQVALRDHKPGSGPAGLWTRQNRLLTLHEEEWSAPVRGLAADWTFRRGFIEEVRVEARGFPDRAGELFLRAPVRRLELVCGLLPSEERTGLCVVLADCLHLAKLNALDLTDSGLGDEALSALLISPHLTNLTELHLRRCRIGDAGFRALARWPHLTRLTCLDLRGNYVSAAGVRTLAQSLERRAASGDLPQLRTLMLDGNSFGEAGRRAVQGSQYLRQAVRFDTAGCKPRGMRYN